MSSSEGTPCFAVMRNGALMSVRGHHEIIKCRCGEIIAQCRCMAIDKKITISSAPCVHGRIICYKCQNIIARDEVASKTAEGFFYHSVAEHCLQTAPTNPYIFNPPPASEMVEPEPTHQPYSLHRRVIGAPNVRRRGPRPLPGQEDTRETTYYRKCARQRCDNEILCYKVVTGTRMVQASHGQESHQVRDYVYYWIDTAIVVETATEYSTRPSQAGLCSNKCLSLWSAKIARDTGE